jgi:hypothetical protein
VGQQISGLFAAFQEEGRENRREDFHLTPLPLLSILAAAKKKIAIAP